MKISAQVLQKQSQRVIDLSAEDHRNLWNSFYLNLYKEALDFYCRYSGDPNWQDL